MLIAEQWFQLGGTHQLLEELSDNLLIEEPIPLFGEAGRMPDRIVWGEAHKPAEQQVVVKLFQQQPLRANPIERLQQ